MRFTMNQVLVKILSEVGERDEVFSGQVISADEHEAIVAALEAEIEAACADRCQDCNSGPLSIAPTRISATLWLHDYGITHIPCKATLQQERRYQRQQEMK